MDIGIGLPTTIPRVAGETVLEWARRADAARFSTLGTIDRVVYGNYDSIPALAAATATISSRPARDDHRVDHQQADPPAAGGARLRATGGRHGSPQPSLANMGVARRATADASATVRTAGRAGSEKPNPPKYQEW